MLTRIIRTWMVFLALAMPITTLGVSTSADAAQKVAKRPAGKPASARSSVNRPKSYPTTQEARPNTRPAGSSTRSSNLSNRSNNTGNRVSNQTAYRAGQASNNYNNNRRDVVVVNPNDDYWEDRYDRWDNDDDDFLEFVGKTAAVTAGVAAVSAVIGSIVKDEPDGCQPTVANGVQYLYCNGTYYQPVSSGYQVVAPPTQR